MPTTTMNPASTHRSLCSGSAVAPQMPTGRPMAARPTMRPYCGQEICRRDSITISPASTHACTTRIGTAWSSPISSVTKGKANTVQPKPVMPSWKCVRKMMRPTTT